MRWILALCLVTGVVPASQAEEIKLMCNSKRGVEHVAVDTALRSVELEEFHTYQGSKTHLVLVFQDGDQTSVIQKHEIDGENSFLPRRDGPQNVWFDPDRIAFSGSLHSEVRSYEINRKSGLMVSKSVNRSGVEFGSFFSQCVAAGPKPLPKGNAAS